MLAAFKKRDFAVGFAVLVIGCLIYFVILPWQLEISTYEGSVTPALFPKLASGAIALLGLIMTLQALLKKTKQAAAVRGLTLNQLGRVIAALFINAAYILAMAWFGFLAATPVFLFGFMYFLGARSIWLMVLFSLAVAGIVYFCFGTLIKVPLPLGYLFE